MAEQPEPPIWVDELVARNEELLKAVAENQALGRLADAVAYQELFQQNVLKLATFCDLSNEVLDSGDATLGGVVNRQDATVQQRVSQSVDAKELENLVEQIPCAQCKRLRIGGNICRGLPPDGKGHMAPNWDYREGPEVVRSPRFDIVMRRLREWWPGVVFFSILTEMLRAGRGGAPRECARRGGALPGIQQEDGGAFRSSKSGHPGGAVC
jgi:hypothetical protein